MRAANPHPKPTRIARCLPHALAAATLAVTVNPAAAQSTATIGSTTLVNQGLVGVGRISASTRDFFGETFGSISGLSVDLSTWRRVGDSYTGSFITLPDRGYNVAGTTNYIDRLQRLTVNFTPYYGTTPLPASQQNQFQANLVGTTLLTEANGNPTTGL